MPLDGGISVANPALSSEVRTGFISRCTSLVPPDPAGIFPAKIPGREGILPPFPAAGLCWALSLWKIESG